MSNDNIVKLTKSSEEGCDDTKLCEQPLKSKEEELHDLKTNNETLVAFSFDEEEYIYMVIAKDKKKYHAYSTFPAVFL